MRDDPYVLVFVEATREEVWLRGVDLNHRPLGYEPNELPDCSTPHTNRNACVLSGQISASVSVAMPEFFFMHRPRPLRSRHLRRSPQLG